MIKVKFVPILAIIVYVKAIAILFLFMVMILNIKLVEILNNTSRYLPLGIIIKGLFL